MPLTVKKKNNENTHSLVNRFSRKVRYSNILRKAIDNQHYSRPLSDLKQKETAIEKKKRRLKYQRLYKLGQL